MSDSRRIIMTTAVGYQPEQCINFLASLRNTGYTGTVVFFVDEPSAQLQQIMHRYGVTPSPIQPRRFRSKRARFYPFISRKLYARHLKTRSIDLYENWLHVCCSRFIAYRRHFQMVSALYDECLLCDMRDVFFQANPFEVDIPSDITFYEEHPQHKLNACSYNSQWILSAYGKKALSSWGRNTAICSGTTHLRGPGILRYLDLMLEQIRTINPTGFGMDQALHNYLAYNVDIPGLTIVPQSQAQVLNIGTTPTDELTFNSDGLLTNSQGQEAALVHQYDRHDTLFDSLLGRLCADASANT